MLTDTAAPDHPTVKLMTWDIASHRGTVVDFVVLEDDGEKLTVRTAGLGGATRVFWREEFDMRARCAVESARFRLAVEWTKARAAAAFAKRAALARRS